MGIIIDLGKIRTRKILTDAYEYAIAQTQLHKFGVDNQDDYPRGIVINFLTKKDKLDWAILELLATELEWFSANKVRLQLGFKTPDYGRRHDMEIYFQSCIATILNENKMTCYADVSYHA